MNISLNRHPLWYAAYILLAAGVAVGLYYSHRSAYRWGVWRAGRPIGLAYIHENEECEGLLLHYNTLALRVYARYPESGSASDRIKVCSRAKMAIQTLEKHVIPRLRKEGRGEEADQLAGRVHEAQDLLAVVEKKQNG